ncbi:hypothetical protein [Mucilaginibacter sp. 44-25]|uniref:hypothetical protein n=1 Tax=Mucilaginibacter sp. 44-25 TaxID=1895794 RepID=UPI0025D945BC|nr:hypothetical protein [Mucilaginibacter sp. 44-25]
MKYKITFKNQFKAIEFLIYGSILFFGLGYFLYRTEGLSRDLISFFSVYYIILLIPTILIHFEYYLRNKNDLFIIDLHQKIISYNTTLSIHFSEIEKIVLYMPPVWHRKGSIRFLPFEDYRYAAIELKSGKRHIITCLMIYDLEKIMSTIPGVTIQKKKRLIASPFLDQLLF